MEPDATEQARVAKDERAFHLPQHKMIVLFGPEPGWLDPQFSSHAEVKADPAPNVSASPDYFGAATGELEKHLFSPGERAEEPTARKLASEHAGIRPAKDAFAGVKLDAQDFLSEAGIPLPAKVFHLGELGHFAV
jgi:hypothetical protein